MKKDYFYDVVLNGSDKFEEYVKLLDETFKNEDQIIEFALLMKKRYNIDKTYKSDIYKFLIKIRDCLCWISYTSKLNNNFDSYRDLYKKIIDIMEALFNVKIGTCIIKDIFENKFNSLFNNEMITPYHCQSYYEYHNHQKETFIAPRLINDYEYYIDTINEKFFIINSYFYKRYYTTKTKINLMNNIKGLFYFNNRDFSNYFDEFIEYFNVEYIDIFIRENRDLDSLLIRFKDREDMFILLNPVNDSYDDIIKQNENSRDVFPKFLLNQNKIKKHLTLSF